jgi:hypothetical protein
MNPLLERITFDPNICFGKPTIYRHPKGPVLLSLVCPKILR